jgi:cytochrome c2
VLAYAAMSTQAARARILLLAILSMLWVGCAGNAGSATADPAVVRGKALFNGACASCHATTDDDVIIGPSLAGISERAGTRVPGMDADAYIRQSIVDPRAYTVEGFPDNMMPINYANVFSPDDIEAILAYLGTLKR